MIKVFMKKKKAIIITITIAIILWSAFFVTDYSRAKNNLPPIFAVYVPYRTNEYKIFVGLGYKIVFYNHIEMRDGFIYQDGIDRVEIGHLFMKIKR